MKNGTQTRLKSLLPYLRPTSGSESSLSPKARMRLKWMRYIEEGHSREETSRHFDHPEATIRYWHNRYNPNKVISLEDRDKTPHNVRKCILHDEDIKLVIDLRKKYPSFGRKKIQVLLRKRGVIIGQTRIQKIINQNSLKRKSIKRKPHRRNRQHMFTVPKEYKQIVGGLVYVDVKHIRLADLRKAYQFTAIDHASRKLIAKVYGRVSSRSGSQFFKHIRRELGVDKICYVGSDNGSEFLGLFEKMLSEQKVTHVFSTPASPKQNGYVERVIRSVIEDFYLYEGTELSINKQQKALDRYIYIYNNIRPHESLSMDTPTERYVKLIHSLPM